MRRNDKLVVISRREFCALAGGLGLAITACASDPQPGTPDAPDTTPDADTATCGGVPAVEVGPASTFATNTPVLFAAFNFYVVRDSGGLYAVSSRCTHQGGMNNVWQAHFICQLHGSEFTFDGDVLAGPAVTPLLHYAMCSLANGHVGVMTTQQVPESTRLSV